MVYTLSMNEELTEPQRWGLLIDYLDDDNHDLFSDELEQLIIGEKPEGESNENTKHPHSKRTKLSRHTPKSNARSCSNGKRGGKNGGSAFE